MVSVGSVTVDVVPDASRFDRDLSAKLNPAAAKAGKQLQDEMSKGIRDGIVKADAGKAAAAKGTEAGGSFADSFQKRVKAALASLPSAKVDLNDEAAQAKLQFLHEELASLGSKQVGIDISDTEAIARLTALRAEMDNLAARSASVQVKVDTARAAAEVDRFLVDTRAKMAVASEETGDEDGSLLAQGMRNSFMRNSPLIAAAVAGGLMAGAPVMLGAAGLLFGGIAAIAVKNSDQVKAATTDLMNTVMHTFKDTAQVTIPWFSAALERLGNAFDNLRPQFGQLFTALQGPIDSLTTGFIGLLNNAMPGFVAAMKSAGPVFQGLGDMLSRIGTGLGDFFGLIAQHGQAAGQVFSAIGQIVQELLPILGTLVGAGTELGSQILPVLANVLGDVANVLQAIAPVLPGIVAGFLAFKAVSALSGPLDWLAGKLSNLGSLGGKAGSAISSLSSSLPVLGGALAAVGVLWEQSQQQISDWANALLQGGTAADQARAQAEALGGEWKALNSASGGLTGQAKDFATAFGLGTNAMDKASSKAKDLYNAMSPLQQKQQDVTKAQNDYLEAVGKWGAASGQALGAASNLRDKEDALKNTQDQLNSVTGTSTSVTGSLKGALQDTADAASAANAQIGLLTGSLNALTGKTVTMGDAEVAVTNATIAATTAVQNKKGALVDATGALNLHTEAGAAAWQALTALTGADNQLIGTMEQQGATSDQVKAKDAQLRDSFIQTAEKMGFSAGQAQNLANQIYGIPATRNTQITNNADDAAVKIHNLQQQIDSLHGRNVSIAILAASSAGPAAYAVPGSGTGGLAKGGVIPGYAPGVDSVHAMLSPGEGVLVPEAVRGIGGAAAIQAINSAYSSRVPGFAAGGVVPPVRVNISETATPFNDALQAAANRMRDQMAVAFAPGAPSSVQGNAGIVKAMAAARGWTGPEWNALYALVMRESGFRNTAQNPTSTAYGMFQFLNSTWGAYGGGKTSDPTAQTRMGLDYIRGRYRDPLGAWAHETKFGWYDRGGVVPPGPSLVYNGTGQPELIAPKQTFQQAMAGASGGGSGPASFTGNLYLDSGEFLGKVRGIAQQETAAGLSTVRDRMAYNS